MKFFSCSWANSIVSLKCLRARVKHWGFKRLGRAWPSVLRTQSPALKGWVFDVKCAIESFTHIEWSFLLFKSIKFVHSKKVFFLTSQLNKSKIHSYGSFSLSFFCALTFYANVSVMLITKLKLTISIFVGYLTKQYEVGRGLMNGSNCNSQP